MAQLIYIIGTVSSKGNLEESGKGNSYLHIILNENLKMKNEIPIVFFGKNVNKIATDVEVGQVILIEAEINVFINQNNGKTWRNVSIVGKSYKIEKAFSPIPNYNKVDAKTVKAEVASALKQKASSSQDTTLVDKPQVSSNEKDYKSKVDISVDKDFDESLFEDFE